METRKAFIKARMLIADRQVTQAKQVLTGIEGGLLRRFNEHERKIIQQYTKAKMLRKTIAAPFKRFYR